MFSDIFKVLTLALILGSVFGSWVVPWYIWLLLVFLIFGLEE
ncbi:hypothetical protein [Faecalibacillus faecis]